MKNSQSRFTPSEIRIREPQTDGSLGVLYGLAIAKNVWSRDLGGFQEMIAEDVEMEYHLDDVRIDYAHDRTRLLGRLSSGTLRLRDRREGVYFELDIPDTTDGRDVAELVRRRDIQGMSFTYVALEEDMDYSGELMQATIRKMLLMEISPVCDPSWVQSSIMERSRELQAHTTEEADKRQRLQAYYEKQDAMLTRARYGGLANHRHCGVLNVSDHAHCDAMRVSSHANPS